MTAGVATVCTEDVSGVLRRRGGEVAPRDRRRQCRDRALVYELRMAVADEQDRVVVKVGDVALQLDGILEKDRDRCLPDAQVVEN